MKRSMSVRMNYRHHLTAGMSEYLPAPLFPFCVKTTKLRWLARMLVWAAILMAWTDGPTLLRQFDLARGVLMAEFSSCLLYTSLVKLGAVGQREGEPISAAGRYQECPVRGELSLIHISAAAGTLE